LLRIEGEVRRREGVRALRIEGGRRGERRGGGC
jgi:hypothetical protein